MKNENENTLLSNLEIKSLAEQDIPTIVLAFQNLGWNKPAAQFEKYLYEQNIGERNVWVAWLKDEFAGYITLKWHSDYSPFKERSIPEINDLNVLPKYRENGIGSKLLELSENEALIKGQFVGIGVGLFSDYGNAQKLYVKRGYVPDGRGITYKNKIVHYGEHLTVDDDLVLWFIKSSKDKIEMNH